MIGGCASENVKSADASSSQKASGTNCAAISAERNRRFKTRGNLTRGQEKTTTICFTRQVPKLAQQDQQGKKNSGLPGWPAGRNADHFWSVQERSVAEKKGCKRKNSQPERTYGLAVSAEYYYCRIGREILLESLALFRLNKYNYISFQNPKYRFEVSQVNGYITVQETAENGA